MNAESRDHFKYWMTTIAECVTEETLNKQTKRGVTQITIQIETNSYKM